MGNCEIVANTLQPRQACGVESAAKKVKSLKYDNYFLVNPISGGVKNGGVLVSNPRIEKSLLY